MRVQNLGLEKSEKNVNEPDWANSNKNKKKTKLNIS